MVAIENQPNISASTEREMDSALNILIAHKDEWARTDVKTRIELITDVMNRMEKVADDWVASSWEAKHLTEDDPTSAEDWAFVTVIFRQLRALMVTLTEIHEDGAPDLRNPLYTRHDGRVICDVFPKFTKDKLFYTSLKGTIWFKKGLHETQIREAMARPYQNLNENTGTVTLVLGAGNVSALVPGDFLHKIFVENHVVMLKMNPVNDYLGKWIQRAFAPLIQRGCLQIAYGGVHEGQYLVHHDLVDELHITGSDATHDAIVFGTGAEGERRKAERNPQVTKRFTSELGNISPMIIVPTGWDESDTIMQAKNLAGRLVANAGFNCLTPRVVITMRGWEHRDLFNQTVLDTLTGIPTRYAYYPNADKRHAMFIEAHPDAHQIGEPKAGHLPWTYITDVDASDTDNIAFTTEAFCGLCAETAIDGENVADYLASAVTFVNEVLWGTLVGSLYVHPKAMDDTAVADAVNHAVEDMRYGTVAINAFGEVAYATASTPWGGVAGQDIYDVQSGIGFVNNTTMFDEAHIEKTVIQQSFGAPINRVDPANNIMSAAIESVARFEAKPNLQRGLNIVWSIITG
ncbi:MAG: hypothetical protein AAFR81_29630 [Chloroflexota bacterium]